jgi:hypothetical protein
MHDFIAECNAHQPCIGMCKNERSSIGSGVPRVVGEVLEESIEETDDAEEDDDDTDAYDYTTWTVKKDGSVKSDHDNLPVEIISPIFSGRDVFVRIPDVFHGVFQHFRYEINNTQGFHVHISHPKLEMVRFFQVWNYFEEVLFSFVHSSRSQNSFCQRRHGTSMAYHVKHQAARMVSRHHVEIRIHQGTMELDEILHWIHLCLALTRFAIHQELELNAIDTTTRESKRKYFFDTVLVEEPGLHRYFATLP